MGTDKASLLWGGRPFADVVAETLAGRCAPVVRVGGPADPAHRSNTAVLADAAEGAGPLAGVVSALRSLDVDRLVVVSCDAPALRVDDLAPLLEQTGAASFRHVNSDRRWPLPCVLPATALDVAEAHLASGRRSLHRLLDALDADQVDLIDESVAERLRGANTPEELAALRSAYEPETS